MSQLDNYQFVNQLRNVQGIKQTYLSDSVPVYVKLCKLKRAVTYLTDKEIKQLQIMGFHFYKDEKTHEDRVHRLQDDIMCNHHSIEKVNLAFNILDKDCDKVRAIATILI